MLRLWGRRNSINVQKVLWCLGELGLGHERIDAGLGFGVNDTPEFEALNPNRLVPVIDDANFVLWESNVIVRYLAERYGSGSLCPDDIRARYDVERWMDWQAAQLWAAMRPVFLGLVRTPPERRDHKAIEQGIGECERAFGILDRHLADRAFVGGARFTMGDIPVGVTAHRWYLLDVARTQFPNLRRWYERIAARPAFRNNVNAPLS